jgi:hypothetical protein
MSKMNVWILTIGTSDVQLESKASNRSRNLSDNQLSEKIWSKWARNCEQDWELNFKPVQAFSEETDPYRISPRALGEVYQESSEQKRKEIQSYLTFPLIENFLKAFPECPVPEVIFLLLTDQSNLFTTPNQRRDRKSPYWQDTVTLELLLTHHLQTHFQENHQTEVRVIPIVLTSEPSEQQGLEDWNAVLSMVQNKFRQLAIDEEPLKPEDCDRVYVSHQAGTPAISSAVQFMSLATFRDSVEFLVSRDSQQFLTQAESNNRYKLIPQSSYLGALRHQEAKALLKRYDYTGVRDILGLTEATGLPGNKKELKILLDAAEQWNFAKFDKFRNKLKNSKLIEKFDFPWYQPGYESAYLSLIRLYQENTVDCIFHSFRAIEGLLIKWVHKFHSSALIDKNKKIKLPREIKVPWYPNNASEVNAHGQGLYYAFLTLSSLSEDDISSDFHIFGKQIFQKRNEMFHKLSGAEGRNAVFEFWEVENQEYLYFSRRLLNCLNLITSQQFQSLEQASFMKKVHQELEKAIEAL